MLKRIKNKLLNYRFFKNIAVKYKSYFSKYKKKVRGKNNSLIRNDTEVNVKFDIVGNNNTIHIHKGAFLSNLLIYMRGDNHQLEIGENCRFKGCCWFEDNNCKIIISSGTTIESADFAVTEPGKKITVGKNCMFSYAIELKTGDSHSIIEKETNKRINYAKDIYIDDHVWIGAHATILKGVRIEKDAIVGAYSVVTKDIPAGCIVAGNPAKIVKDNIYWKSERIYENE
ncbi:MAG: acyltransferase [Candidatus Azobacteroides sp.]|nr:acyltransferase [Candidatus Azobacteroides sp.]